MNCLHEGIKDQKISLNLAIQRLSEIKKTFIAPRLPSFIEKQWKQAWFAASVELLSAKLKSAKFKNNRFQGWQQINRLLPIRSWSSSSTEAYFYKTISELAFLEQKLDLAAYYAEESLKLKKDSELQEKMKSLRKMMGIAAQDKEKK